jgi:hypothetical protein
MGHLLSSAIKMQGGAAAPQLQYESIDMAGGTVLVKRNGTTIATLTTDTALTTVTLDAGDTIQMTYSRASGLLTTFIYYYLNGTLTNTYSGTLTITGAVLTASAGNIYKFSYQGSA